MCWADAGAETCFITLAREAAEVGATLCLCGMKTTVRQVLEQCEVLPVLGTTAEGATETEAEWRWPVKSFTSRDAALEWCEAELLDFDAAEDSTDSVAAILSNFLTQFMVPDRGESIRCSECLQRVTNTAWLNIRWWSGCPRSFHY